MAAARRIVVCSDRPRHPLPLPHTLVYGPLGTGGVALSEEPCDVLVLDFTTTDGPVEVACAALCQSIADSVRRVIVVVPAYEADNEEHDLRDALAAWNQRGDAPRASLVHVDAIYDRTMGDAIDHVQLHVLYAMHSRGWDHHSLVRIATAADALRDIAEGLEDFWETATSAPARGLAEALCEHGVYDETGGSWRTPGEIAEHLELLRAAVPTLQQYRRIARDCYCELFCDAQLRELYVCTHGCCGPYDGNAQPPCGGGVVACSAVPRRAFDAARKRQRRIEQEREEEEEQEDAATESRDDDGGHQSSCLVTTRGA